MSYKNFEYDYIWKNVSVQKIINLVIQNWRQKMQKGIKIFFWFYKKSILRFLKKKVLFYIKNKK